MGKGSALGILGLLIGAGGLGFGVYIFISFGAQIANLEDSASSICDSGRIWETQKVVSNSDAVITDDDTTKTQMPDMNISITTYGESYLAIRFFTNLYLEILDQLTCTWCFDVNIEFQNKVVCNAMILYSYEEWPYPDDTDIDTWYTIPIYLEYITDTLYAGTYDIKITWQSLASSTVDYIRLIASIENSGLLNVNRTLIVQEIAQCPLFAPIGF